MRNFSLFAIGFVLMACSAAEVEKLTPSDLSSQLVSVYAGEFSKQEIEYCGPAFIKASLNDAGLKVMPVYSELPRETKKAVDRWLGAYREVTKDNQSLSKLIARGNGAVMAFMANPDDSALSGVNVALLTKCSTVGMELQFDAIRRAIDGGK